MGSINRIADKDLSFSVASKGDLLQASKAIHDELRDGFKVELESACKAMHAKVWAAVQQTMSRAITEALLPLREQVAASLKAEVEEHSRKVLEELQGHTTKGLKVASKALYRKVTPTLEAQAKDLASSEVMALKKRLDSLERLVEGRLASFEQILERVVGRFVEAVRSIPAPEVTVNVPELKPTFEVSVPEVRPEVVVNVPEAQPVVNVNVPEQKLVKKTIRYEGGFPVEVVEAEA